jgi:superfamily II DNA or RNA helicase
MEEEITPNPFRLSQSETVERHQLNLLKFWDEKNAESAVSTDLPLLLVNTEIPEKWNLLGGIPLRDWQAECRERWFGSSKRGVVKVVTGAGKTIMALGIIEALQNRACPDLRVAIVVPTIVLQDQWYDLLTGFGNLPASAIGLVGGSHRDSFDDDKRILVSVLNSAATKLPKMSESLSHPLMLVVDECHRAGSAQMSAVFGTKRSFSLGLSATPEREAKDAEDLDIPEDSEIPEEHFDDSIIGRELGPIIYELGYKEALEAGILAKFELQHYGLPLEPEERTRYEKISREITDLRRMLQSQPGARGMDGGALVGWARKQAARGKSGISSQAASYVALTGQRKQLVYHAKARGSAVEKLLQQALDESSSSRILLFHESISEVMRLFAALRLKGIPAVAEHSQLSDSLRAESLHLFRSGAARVLISAKSLIEGFDVPAADVGIVVASSSSVRQRIQTLGRILRKKPGEERTATLHILYMSETTDEMIYQKQDWAEVTGAERNRYFVWDPTGDSAPSEKVGPPRTPKPGEDRIEMSSLAVGDEYPGDYEGQEFTADAQGNIKDYQGDVFGPSQGIPDLVQRLRGSHGRFRVTTKKRALLIAIEGRILFGGLLVQPLEKSAIAAKKTDGLELIVKTKADGYRIAIKTPRGEAYARRTDTATDANKGRDAEALALKIRELESELGRPIRKIHLSAGNQVSVTAEGKIIEVMALEDGLEFPETNPPTSTPETP